MDSWRNTISSSVSGFEAPSSRPSITNSPSFSLVVGAKEQETRTVNIRNRDDPATQKMGELIPLQAALERLVELRDQRRLESKIEMHE